MRSLAFVALAVVACSSSSPGGDDASADGPSSDGFDPCNVVTTDASFTCDVSAIPLADRGCATWSGPADTSGGGFSCPGSIWTGESGGETCTYTWDKSGPPDLCSLPSAEDGRSAFAWLRPACASACDASIDVPVVPCTSSDVCAGDEYCELHGDCNGSGICAPINGGGVGVKQQVCGCDGQTYASAADAHQARTSVAYAGACE